MSRFFCSHRSGSRQGQKVLEFGWAPFTLLVTLYQSKAAEDSHTPRRWRVLAHATESARFWSAAVLCRFQLTSFRRINNYTRFGRRLLEPGH